MERKKKLSILKKQNITMIYTTNMNRRKNMMTYSISSFILLGWMGLVLLGSDNNCIIGFTGRRKGAGVLKVHAFTSSSTTTTKLIPRTSSQTQIIHTHNSNNNNNSNNHNENNRHICTAYSIQNEHMIHDNNMDTKNNLTFLSRTSASASASASGTRSTTRTNSVLKAATTSSIQETNPEPKSQLNDFQPTTMSLTKSMLYFATYLMQQSKEDRIKILLSRQNNNKKPKFLSRFSTRFSRRAGMNSSNSSSSSSSSSSNNQKNNNNKRILLEKYDTKLIQRLQDEIEQEQAEKKPFSETLATLNKARKEMIELVGYNSALLVPCFGFAGLAAFMNSVIPHYYGLCINCLANASTTTQSEVVKAITGLAWANFLCALFTGARGALFWLAGEYCFCFCFVFVE